MKKSLLIICFLSMTGLYAQEELFVSQTQESTKASRVDNITYSIAEYEAMIKRGKELITKIKEHDKLIQKGSMSKAAIKEWKKDMLEAKLLNYRISDFTTKYLNAGYSLIDNVSTEVLSDYYDFSKTLETSDQYAGF